MATSETKSWVIGASPECDLVFDAPTVSGRHCRLTFRGGEWLLEDLASTNGTHVNGQRINKPTTVSRNDRITLGQSAVMPWPSVTGIESAETNSAGGKNPIAVIATAALLLVAILIGVVWMNRDSNSDDTPKPDKPAAKTKGLAENDQKPDNPAAAVRPEQTLFVILVGTEDQSLTMRLGTAFAVSPRHLVTTAEIVNSIKQLSGKYPVISVYCPETKQQLAVNLSGARLHPKIEPLFREEQELKRKIAVLRVQIDEILERLNRNVGEGKKPETGKTAPKQPAGKTTKQDAEALKQYGDELAGLDNRFAKLKETQRFYDLAVLEVPSELKQRLPVVSSDQQLFANHPVTIRGVSFPTTQFASLDRSTLKPALLAAEIRQLPRLDGADGKSDRLIVQTESVRLPGTDDKQPAEFQWWVGSPVLNGDGNVIGIYSALTLAAKPEEPPSGKYHDITRIGGLRAIAPELLTDSAQQQSTSSP